MPWQLLTPPVGVSPKGATMVRIALVNDSAPASAVAVTAPFHYSYEQLARTFAGSPATLVMPHVATFFPCLQLPRLRSGVVETPHLVVSTVNAQPLLLDPGTSPFNGMLDLYDIQRLPVVDSKGRKSDIAVYAVAQDIPGWQRTDAERVATTS